MGVRVRIEVLLIFLTNSKRIAKYSKISNGKVEKKSKFGKIPDEPQIVVYLYSRIPTTLCFYYLFSLRQNPFFYTGLNLNLSDAKVKV